MNVGMYDESQDYPNNNNRIVTNTGLEGIVRLFSNPSKKLLVRNFYSVPKFIFSIIFNKRTSRYF